MKHGEAFALTFVDEPPAPVQPAPTPAPDLDRYIAPDSRRPHGTRAKYVVDKCRCEPCTADNLAKANERRHAISRPDETWVPYVPAGRARDHVRDLAAHGIGLKTIAKVSGVSHGALWKLMYGDTKRPVHHHPPRPQRGARRGAHRQLPAAARTGPRGAAGDAARGAGHLRAGARHRTQHRTGEAVTQPTNHLDIADGVSLPEDYVTKTAAICAQRRKGKTYTAAVIAEELVRLGHPWVAFDPTSAWWGLRASADGKSEGLPVVIIGGDHGDLPLEASAGRFIADLVVDHPGWYVLDLSLLGTRAAERQFATDFADRLYRRKSNAQHRFPLHFFVDEADLFAPQDKEAGDNKMLGAFQAIVRRGGILGLGCTLITQRPALLNKSVLTQLDLLILLRLVAGNDQDAVDKNYIQRAGSKEQRAELMGSLASLVLGEAWLWEPGADPALFVRAQIRQRHTFNSSATPKVGETPIEPTRLADVDLAVIKEQMADTIEKAKADDPRELRRRIRDLERQLAERPTAPEPAVEFIEIPLLDESLVARFEETVSELARLGQHFTERADVLAENLGMARVLVDGAPGGKDQRHDRRQDVPRAGTAGRRPRAVEAPRSAERPDSAVRRQPRRETVPRAAEGADGELTKAERAILTALAQYPEGRRNTQLTTLTGKAWTGGFRNYLSKFRTDGWIVGGNQDVMRITDAGLDALGDWDPLPTGADLLDHWLAQLKPAEAEVLAAIAAHHPDSVAGPDLAAELGKGWTGGFRNYLSKLRTLDLIEGRNNDVRLSENLT